MHPRAKERGEWQTRLEHYPPEKAAYLERTPERCREIARGIGPETAKVVDALLDERPLDRLRAAQRLLKLECQHRSGSPQKAPNRNSPA